MGEERKQSQQGVRSGQHGGHGDQSGQQNQQGPQEKDKSKKRQQGSHQSGGQHKRVELCGGVSFTAPQQQFRESSNSNTAQNTSQRKRGSYDYLSSWPPKRSFAHSSDRSDGY